MSDQSTIHIDIVSDVVCPWCVIGYLQLASAANNIGVELTVHWHPFELNPQMLIEGENLRDHIKAKYGTTQENWVATCERITQLGAELGFTFNYSDDMHMYNTYSAHQIIEWANGYDMGHQMNLALFDAFFTQRKNISDYNVLSALSSEIGLDPYEALSQLENGGQTHKVREKQRYWIERGVQGVPAMLIAQRNYVVGAQGADNYAELLQQNLSNL